MSDNKNEVGARDRRQVAGQEDYEVQHFATAEGISVQQARELIAKHGNDRTVLAAAAAKLKQH